MKPIILSILGFLGFSSIVLGDVATTSIESEIVGETIPIRVFYPTDEQASLTKFGPWQVQMIKNAAIAPGQHPLVMISHGLGGGRWNFHMLASDLVNAGFIVAALEHPDDFLRVDRDAYWRLRPYQFKRALDAVLSNAEFASQIDQDKIGAFGYSLGGYTVLAAIGGVVDPKRFEQHCQIHDDDPRACQPIPMIWKLRRSMHQVPSLPEDTTIFDARFRVAVLAAPVGVPFENLGAVNVPILLLRAGEDRELEYPFHAEHIHQLLKSSHDYRVLEDAHHYAFLSPFPASIAAEVGEPAIDPEGFDRLSFIAKTNANITRFFTEHLIKSTLAEAEKISD